MKIKRLNRDGWGFQNYPYYQMRIDSEEFKGIACLIRLIDGTPNYWQTPKAGKVQVTGEGLTWLELVPDDCSRVITVVYYPEGQHDSERKNYPAASDVRYQPSVWYVDIIEGIDCDEDGVMAFIDKYLDVIFTPEGDVMVDDRDELDAAHASGELSGKQYADALREGDIILDELCKDIPRTDQWCARIRDIVERRIAEGAAPYFLYHGSQYDLDTLKPMQAKGANKKESQLAIYAAASPKEVIPFALPIRWYPDSPEGKRSFECNGSRTRLIYGSLDPEGVGYIYRLRSSGFQKLDEWQWISATECEFVEKIQIKVRDYMDTVEFSEEAKRIQRLLYGVQN